MGDFMKKYMRVRVIFLILMLFMVNGCSNHTAVENANSSVKSNSTDTDQSSGATWPTKEWSTSTPEQQGLNAEMLSKADERIKENYSNVYSLLVVRHGYLVYEKYYQGMDENDANPVYSVTKSVMSALTGIALNENLIQNVDQKVSEFLPEYFKDIDNAKKKDITIKNVLTMSGGLESIDNDYGAYFTSEDWIQYAIQKPLSINPGEQFEYNTGLTHLLSGIITETSGMDTKEYADKKLFHPIGMSVDFWDCDQKGYNCGGSRLSLRPVDMAKFGYLYLNHGSWDGKQIIPEKWIEESIQKQITANEDQDYGYLFWLQKIQDSTHNRQYATYRCDGAGGQKIMMIPELDMVVVITADYYKSSKDGSDNQDIITDYVVPAVEK